MSAAKIKKGDRVVVLSGKDKGKRGEVIRALPAEDRVVVSGVNIIKRHQKATGQKQGGIDRKEAPIHVSKVAVEDPKTGKPSRVGFKLLEDGTKVRFAKKSGEMING
jgi:large subunit ribosomal protein L24